MRNIVILDYGHGWDTPGKRSPDGLLREGRWTREVGPMLARELRELGLTVCEIITEKDDVSLQERCNRVNDIVKKNPHDNIIFVSLHINAAPGTGWDDKASGACVWVCKNASESSVTLGQYYTEYMKLLNLQGNRSIPKEQVWRANFKVLKSTNCPAILTENLFMTNHNEVKFLQSDLGKETIVNLHILTICKYFEIPCMLVTD